MNQIGIREQTSLIASALGVPDYPPGYMGYDFLMQIYRIQMRVHLYLMDVMSREIEDLFKEDNETAQY